MASPFLDDADRLSADGPVPITELARRFLLPESTARYYCKRFLPWLAHSGQGKRRRFLPEAIPVFAFIVEGMQEHKDAKAVEASLGSPLPASQAPQAAAEGRVPLGNGLRANQPTLPAVRMGDAAVLQPTVVEPHTLGELAQAVRHQTQNMGDALEAIASTLAAMQSQHNEIADLRSELHKSRKESQQLREEMQRLIVLQDSAEKTHQQDLEQLRKWLGALARQQGKGQDAE